MAEQVPARKNRIVVMTDDLSRVVADKLPSVKDAVKFLAEADTQALGSSGPFTILSVRRSGITFAPAKRQVLKGQTYGGGGKPRKPKDPTAPKGK